MTDIVLVDEHAAFADPLAAVLENHGVKVLGVEGTLENLIAATAGPVTAQPWAVGTTESRRGGATRSRVSTTSPQ